MIAMTCSSRHPSGPPGGAVGTLLHRLRLTYLTWITTEFHGHVMGIAPDFRTLVMI